MFRTSNVHLQEDYLVHVGLHGMFFMRLWKQYTWLNDVLETYHISLHLQYSLPEDEHQMFETCTWRRQEELNQNINFKSVFCWLILHNCITMRGAKKRNVSPNKWPSLGH
jgi:hypothetical protein